MHIRAERDPRYYFRFIIIGWAALGFGLWALYDGAVKYPQQRERGLAFDKLMDEGRDKEWDQYARDHGWPTDYPGEPKSIVDIQLQYVMAAVASTIGGLVLLNVWLSRGRWIEADDTGLNSSWGERVPYDKILTLDKKSWRSKGIARVKYEENGRRRKFVIDDYKFMRGPTDDILYELEERIEPDKIIGGPPEPMKEAEGTADAASGEAAPVS
jgi:hypothetical protein